MIVIPRGLVSVAVTGTVLKKIDLPFFREVLLILGMVELMADEEGGPVVRGLGYCTMGRSIYSDYYKCASHLVPRLSRLGCCGKRFTCRASHTYRVENPALIMRPTTICCFGSIQLPQDQSDR